MLAEGTAKVSFVNYESVGHVLALTHKLDSHDLVMKAYFDFLQPAEGLPSQDSATGGQNVPQRSLKDIPMQTSPPANKQTPPQMKPRVAHEAVEVAAEEVMDQTEDVELVLSSHVAIADPLKLSVLQHSTFLKDTKKAHPNFTIHIKDNGVHIEGTDRQRVEQIKHKILDCFGKMAEINLTFEPEEAQFLAREDVKQRLLETVNQPASPTLYSVSDCTVSVTSLSLNSANQLSSLIQSQLCHFTVPVDAELETMLYCREWSEFMQALSFCLVKVSEQGGIIDGFTLKGMESEKQTEIMGFLTTPIERETVISMEPGRLKYIQIHRHQLMADMNQVSIFPLEAEDACGLKIHGHATACEMAEEVLQSVVSSICTRTITVNAPGVTRFLEDAECQRILKEMEKKFQVYISLKYVPWQHLPHQDVFDTAWNMMSCRNFPKVSPDGVPQELKADSTHTNQNGAPGLLESAKKNASAVDEDLGANNLDDMDDVDLYSAEEPTALMDQDFSATASDASQPSASQLLQTDIAMGLSSELEEEAQLSLAIQYSMETSQYSLEDEEEQLQKALELSKKMTQHESSSSSPDKSPAGKKSFDTSLQDTIKAANTLQLFVFAGYPADLIRVDIAFGKRVTGRQVEEKLENRCVRNLSDYHRICLDMIKRKHAVDIQIQGTIITVSGFKDFVAGGVFDVKLLLDKISSSVSEREILKSVQWVYHDPVSSDTTPYSPDATVFIETAVKMRLQKVDILLDNQPHTINFEKMQEYNIATGKSVKISRKTPTSGALDEDIPEEEYSLLSNLPEVSKVDEESDEFQNVVKNFYETIKEYHSKIRIIKVEKLMNRLLYNQYKLKKASVLRHATYPVIEQTLYHGTSEKSVKEICVHGFNRSFCGKNATVYGQGVYFAVNSALSVQETYSPPNADGHKYIFVSKVLTGDYTIGCHSMKTAPLKETDDIPLRYDSVTDDITKPGMFVIFNDTQAFPEYLITCQRITRG
ncbi:hypothetical protein PBY51_005533 [Eleginops maclovinus]|uniref:Poly [ADP-ribose] polymerase n=2 Tax=Eleginops maclovinus TaxID=56733 RepID=A0AAN8AHP1_ELEMC|nr:hypothetical protein PBY51_005533 [Eleginops maclovinus]